MREVGIPILIKNTNRPEDRGTIISETAEVGANEHLITGVAGKKDFLAVHAALRSHERPALREHLDDADREGKRRVLHERDDLVAHGGEDPLDHLGQDDSEEGLPVGVTEHLRCLVLSLGHALDARAVDFGEVGRVVDDEGDDHGGEHVVGIGPNAEHVVRHEEDRKHLEHEGRAAHHRDDELHEE